MTTIPCTCGCGVDVISHATRGGRLVVVVMREAASAEPVNTEALNAANANIAAGLDAFFDVASNESAGLAWLYAGFAGEVGTEATRACPHQVDGLGSGANPARGDGALGRARPARLRIRRSHWLRSHRLKARLNQRAHRLRLVPISVGKAKCIDPLRGLARQADNPADGAFGVH